MLAAAMKGVLIFPCFALSLTFRPLDLAIASQVMSSRVMSYDCVCRGDHNATERRREMRPMQLLLDDWNGQAVQIRSVGWSADVPRPTGTGGARQKFRHDVFHVAR